MVALLAPPPVDLREETPMPRPERLGPYKIGEPLGKGGMGQVYQAVHEESGDRVAVKVLSPELAMAEGFRERFEAEIESLKMLRHAGIVQLFGYGESDGAVFYSMELVDGASLEEELRAGRRFNWREVVQIAIQLCRALKHAHDHGIIHRDIKPANILLDQQERVKLADFGIARLFGSTQLTTAGGVLGTADFMSPEQADGRPVNDRCDQYSLGCVMYALLAGRPPFRAKTLPEMLQLQRFAKPEPVRRYAPQTPMHLEKAIGQMLAKSPADRFPNTVVLARHLEAMTLALTKPERDDFRVIDDEVGDLPTGDDSAPIDMAITQADARQEAEGESIDLPGARSGSATEMVRELPTLVAGDDLEEEPDPTEGKSFTVVRQEAGDDAQPLWQVAAPWAVILLMVAAAAYGGYSWLQPRSADVLYAELQDTTDEQWAAGDSTAQADLEEFLRRFPNDPRVAALEPRQQELNAAGLERRLRLAVLRGDTVGTALSVEQELYVDAMRAQRTDPAQAERMLVRLERLLGVEAPTVGEDPATRTDHAARQGLATLVKRQLEELQNNSQARAERHLPYARSRLALARNLSQARPDEAREILDAIIELYNREPWAAGVVAKARDLRNQLEPEE